MKFKKAVFFMAIFGLGSSQLVFAENQSQRPGSGEETGHREGGGKGESGGNGRGEPRRPPREALEACTNKSDSAECSFKGRDGESVKGKCWRPDQERPLACKPSNMPTHMKEGSNHN